MARKKSAAKKAKEQAAEQATNPEVAKPVVETSDVTSDPADISPPSDDSEESEEEDEYGDLLTKDVETLINKVLTAIKTKLVDLLDPNTKFFGDAEVATAKQARDKPMYLKDYHRKQLLSGDYKDDTEDNEYGTVDGEKPYTVVEREERNKLISDIKDAFKGDDSDNDDEEDTFLQKKETTHQKEESVQLPDPNANAEEFLSSFLSNEAWIPRKNDKVLDLDQIDKDDEQDFDDAVEDFEKAYNFRYEDPNSAEIVSYARTQATLRRGKTNARKRARDKKHAIKEQEKHEVEQALQKKKTQKVNKVMDRLAKIKEAVGDDISDEVIDKVFGDSLLNDDFDDADWDNRMAEIFNEQYYGSELTKPEWGEDDEIMAEFHTEKNQENTEDASEEATNEEDGEDAQPAESQAKLKKDKIKEKSLAKKEKKTLKEKAQKLVEANTLKIRDEVEEERGRARGDDVKFKYREVSPESYGLSTREIFLADDQDLNKYYSIKKFAPYKPKEKALQDKRKYAKKKQLQQWRREVFKDKNGPARQAQEKDDEIWIPVENTEEPPEKKHKHNHKGLKHKTK